LVFYANGLDEWAQHFYGVASFDEANEEQQADLLRRYRVGTYVFPAKVKPWTGLDEREIGERDGASRWALQRIGLLPATYAGTLAVQRQPLTQMEASGYLWGFSLLARTLPQARGRWSWWSEGLELATTMTTAMTMTTATAKATADPIRG
jgi:hypothetical protein